MTKRELQALLSRYDSSLSELCRDLGLAYSTASRWGDQVPRYAVAFAVAMRKLTPESRADVRVLLGRHHASAGSDGKIHRARRDDALRGWQRP